MRLTHTLLRLLNEIFPYSGMPTGFKGAHSIMLCPDKDNAVDILVWHLGRAWPVTATLDEFELVNESGPRPKTEPELRLVVQAMKAHIDSLAAAKLAKVP